MYKLNVAEKLQVVVLTVFQVLTHHYSENSVSVVPCNGCHTTAWLRAEIAKTRAPDPVLPSATACLFYSSLELAS